MPHLVLPEYEQTIWVDGSALVTSNTFVEEALSYLGETGLTMWAHPNRDDLYDEAVASLQYPKYAYYPIAQQAEHYRVQGHPEHWGLWASGVIARRTDDKVQNLMEMWLGEVYRWGRQCQISLPYCLRTLGMRPDEFPGTIYQNPWLTITHHNPNQ
jgi:hypothetical protein